MASYTTQTGGDDDLRKALESCIPLTSQQANILRGAKGNKLELEVEFNLFGYDKKSKTYFDTMKIDQTVFNRIKGMYKVAETNHFSDTYYRVPISNASSKRLEALGGLHRWDGRGERMIEVRKRINYSKGYNSFLSDTAKVLDNVIIRKNRLPDTNAQVEGYGVKVRKSIEIVLAGNIPPEDLESIVQHINKLDNMSKSGPLPSKDDRRLANIIYKRFQTRYKIALGNGISLHMSEVYSLPLSTHSQQAYEKRTLSSISQPIVSYSIELEQLYPVNYELASTLRSSSVDTFINQVIKLYLDINMSTLLFNLSDRSDSLQAFQSINMPNIPQATVLTPNDLTKYYLFDREDGKRFCMMHKYDGGTRCQVMIDAKLGIWAKYYSGMLSLLHRFTPDTPFKLNRCIIDAEVIPPGNHKVSGKEDMYVVIAYNAIMYDGTNVTTNTTLAERLDMCESIYQGIQSIEEGVSRRFLYNVAAASPFESRQALIKTMISMITSQATLPFHFDGLIIKPYDSWYNPEDEYEKVMKTGGMKDDIHRLQIFKWKPIDKDSIDVLFQTTDKINYVNIYGYEKGVPYVPLTGIEGVSFGKPQYIEGALLSGVAEIQYDPSLSTLWRLLRYRPDRSNPNRVSVIMEQLYYFLNPLSYEVMIGVTNGLLEIALKRYITNLYLRVSQTKTVSIFSHIPIRSFLFDNTPGSILPLTTPPDKQETIIYFLTDPPYEHYTYLKEKEVLVVNFHYDTMLDILYVPSREEQESKRKDQSVRVAALFNMHPHEDDPVGDDIATQYIEGKLSLDQTVSSLPRNRDYALLGDDMAVVNLTLTTGAFNQVVKRSERLRVIERNVYNPNTVLDKSNNYPLLTDVQETLLSLISLSTMEQPTDQPNPQDTPLTVPNPSEEVQGTVQQEEVDITDKTIRPSSSYDDITLRRANISTEQSTNRALSAEATPRKGYVPVDVMEQAQHIMTKVEEAYGATIPKVISTHATPRSEGEPVAFNDYSYMNGIPRTGLFDNIWTKQGFSLVRLKREQPANTKVLIEDDTTAIEILPPDDNSTSYGVITLDDIFSSARSADPPRTPRFMIIGLMGKEHTLIASFLACTFARYQKESSRFFIFNNLRTVYPTVFTNELSDFIRMHDQFLNRETKAYEHSTFATIDANYTSVISEQLPLLANEQYEADHGVLPYLAHLLGVSIGLVSNEGMSNPKHYSVVAYEHVEIQTNPGKLRRLTIIIAYDVVSQKYYPVGHLVLKDGVGKLQTLFDDHTSVV